MDYQLPKYCIALYNPQHFYLFLKSSIKVFDHGQCCTLADGMEVEQIQSIFEVLWSSFRFKVTILTDILYSNESEDFV